MASSSCTGPPTRKSPGLKAERQGVEAPVSQQEDKPSTGLNILAFLFPVIGLILFLCFQKTTPVRAKAIGKWALIGFIVGIVLSVLGALFS